MLNQYEFLKREINLYGEDEIYGLLDRGYTVKMTDRGFKWFAPEPNHLRHGAERASLATARPRRFSPVSARERG